MNIEQCTSFHPERYIYHILLFRCFSELRDMYSRDSSRFLFFFFASFFSVSSNIPRDSDDRSPTNYVLSQVIITRIITRRYRLCILTKTVKIIKRFYSPIREIIIYETYFLNKNIVSLTLRVLFFYLGY